MKIENGKLICEVLKDSKTGEPLVFDASKYSEEEIRELLVVGECAKNIALDQLKAFKRMKENES
jgi:N12 class adenine-specific DNA methylase